MAFFTDGERLKHQHNMYQRLIIQKILSVVAEISNISEEQILSRSRYAEVVDARHLCVFLMYKHHIPKHRIADIFSLTCRNIHHILAQFDTRRQYGDAMLNILLKMAQDRLK